LVTPWRLSPEEKGEKGRACLRMTCRRGPACLGGAGCTGQRPSAEKNTRSTPQKLGKNCARGTDKRDKNRLGGGWGQKEAETAPGRSKLPGRRSLRKGAREKKKGARTSREKEHRSLEHQGYGTNPAFGNVMGKGWNKIDRTGGVRNKNW